MAMASPAPPSGSPGSASGVLQQHRPILREFSCRAEAGSVPRVRHRVRDTLAEWGLAPGSEPVELAQLVVSELVTNGVVHAGARSPRLDVAVRLDRAARWLVLAVHDRHPVRPVLHAALPPDHATGGRGLLLVERFADEAGGRSTVVADGDGGGKTLSVMLPVASPSG